jgi:ribosome maturation factor RimP
MGDEVKQQIAALIEQPLAAEGCELAELLVSRYKNNVTVRLFVYSENGPTVEQCIHLSAVVGNALDGTEMFPAGYTLEVSSPGLDRPLKTARDFKYRVGETVRVEFVDPKRKKITAEIVSAAEEQVEFKDDNGTYVIPLGEIERARIVF